MGRQDGSEQDSLFAPRVDRPEIFISLPLRDGREFPVSAKLVAEFDPLYPAVDVPQTLREMRGWLIGNPSRRKTRRGIMRFITAWLQGEQEKYGRQAGT